MNAKEFEMLVQSEPEGEIKPLKQILDRGRRLEMEALNGRFAGLWSLYVYVDPAVLGGMSVAQKNDLSALCEERIGFANDLAGLHNRGHSYAEQMAVRATERWSLSHANVKVPAAVVIELEELVADFGYLPDIVERLQIPLAERMAGERSSPDSPPPSTQETLGLVAASVPRTRKRARSTPAITIPPRTRRQATPPGTTGRPDRPEEEPVAPREAGEPETAVAGTEASTTLLEPARVLE